eukprot:403373330
MYQQRHQNHLQVLNKLIKNSSTSVDLFPQFPLNSERATLPKQKIHSSIPENAKSSTRPLTSLKARPNNSIIENGQQSNTVLTQNQKMPQLLKYQQFQQQQQMMSTYNQSTNIEGSNETLTNTQGVISQKLLRQKSNHLFTDALSQSQTQNQTINLTTNRQGINGSVIQSSRPQSNIKNLAAQLALSVNYTNTKKTTPLVRQPTTTEQEISRQKSIKKQVSSSTFLPYGLRPNGKLQNKQGRKYSDSPSEKSSLVTVSSVDGSDTEMNDVVIENKKMGQSKSTKLLINQSKNATRKLVISYIRQIEGSAEKLIKTVSNEQWQDIEDITELDEVKKQYYGKLDEERRRAQRFFKIRDYQSARRHIDEMLSMASHAYDLETLRTTFHLKAVVSIFFDDYQSALVAFRCLRNVAADEENDYSKMLAYENMGKCYNALKNYENAIKCFKKQLELAWRHNDAQEELRAYEQLGMQHYYLGNLEKSKYYNDRCMRGKTEKQNSKIRSLYNGYNQAKSNYEASGKNERVTFKKLKEILESFQYIKNDLVRSIKRKIIAQTFGTGNLQEALDFYRNGLIQSERPLKLKEGSPISQISMTHLPSPRMVIEDNKMKNAQLLPHFGDNSDLNENLSKKDKFLLAVAKNKSKNGILSKKDQTEAQQGIFKVAEQYGGDFLSELNVMNRGKIKSNEVLEEFREKRLRSQNIKGEVDMKEVIRKARQRSEKQNAFIAINHLSPNRNLRHFQENEDVRNAGAQGQFQTMENDIKQKVTLIDNQAVRIDLMSEEQALKILDPQGSRNLGKGVGKKSMILKKKTTNLTSSNDIQQQNNIQRLNLFKNAMNANSTNNLQNYLKRGSMIYQGGNGNGSDSLISGMNNSNSGGSGNQGFGGFMLQAQKTIKDMDKQKQINNMLSQSQQNLQKINITLMASVKQPQNIRLKKYNELVNQALSNTPNLIQRKPQQQQQQDIVNINIQNKNSNFMQSSAFGNDKNPSGSNLFGKMTLGGSASMKQL